MTFNEHLGLAWPDLSNHIIVGIQLCFCTCALSILFALKYLYPPHTRSVQSLIYGICLFLCGLCSYLYTTRYTGLSLNLLRHFDHAAIFLLIAGTYTPFATKEIKGPFNIRLLHWIWSIACVGIILRLILENQYDRVFVALYVAMGWVFVMSLKSVLKHVPHFSLWLLGSGAAVYTIGAVIFFANLTVWTDSIWHICVMTAAVLHFISILGLLTGRNNISATHAPA